MNSTQIRDKRIITTIIILVHSHNRVTSTYLIILIKQIH